MWPRSGRLVPRSNKSANCCTHLWPPLPCCAQTNPKLHDTIIERLMDTFPAIRTSRVVACALWILSEYCSTKEEIAAALEVRLGGALVSNGGLVVARIA
jgi:hypothetical protein